jgi:hypothetical protein
MVVEIHVDISRLIIFMTNGRLGRGRGLGHHIGFRSIRSDWNQNSFPSFRLNVHGGI